MPLSRQRPSLPAPTLAARYCVRHRISPDAFDSAIFRRALYLHARVLRFLIAPFRRDFFAPDRELIHSVGALTSLRDFRVEELTFHAHPGNSHLLRRALFVRVSTRRLRKLLTLQREQIASAPAGETEPS